jgi:hypothetical protein
MKPDVQTWPSISVEIELFPWHWHRPRLYRDDIHPTWLEFGFAAIKVGVIVNRPLFPMRETEDRPFLNLID